MAERYTIQGVGKSFSKCRVHVRTFNNTIKDVQLGRIYEDVPCRVCKDQILNEANELSKECDRFIKHYKKHQESSMRDKYPCDYAIACGDLAMRDGTRGKNKDRSNTKQHQPDSGFLSGGSEILGRAATESQDYSQAPSADIIFPNDPDKDVQTEMPSSSCNKADIEGPCVTLEGSMDDSNTKNA